MNGIADRSARFRSVIALKGSLPSSQGPILFEETADGVVPGSITLEPKGDGGFGYDPVFLVDSTGKTYAEMSMTEKNALSHRSLAVQKAILDLKDILAKHGIPLTDTNASL
jgi:XTP/dITP diphosphohydrolase